MIDTMLISDVANLKQKYPSTSSTTESIATVEEVKSSVYKDVWYRQFLKPFAGRGEVAYIDSFTRRVLPSSGIPAEKLHGIHELFRPSYKYYSPLFGMIFNFNNFIDNLYKYGNSSDPAVQTVRDILPGGEIQTTHADSEAAAHFTPAIVGGIFEIIEKEKEISREMIPSFCVQKLASDILDFIMRHPDSLQAHDQIRQTVKDAETKLRILREREENASEIRSQIKHLEGDILKVAKRKYKKLQNEQKKSQKSDRLVELQLLLDEQLQIMESTESELAHLRALIVTSLDFKIARKALRRAEDALNHETMDQRAIATKLAESFMAYDFPFSTSTELPFFSTTSILQAFLWRKYNRIESLIEYFRSMDRIGATTKPITDIINILETIPETSFLTRKRILRQKAIVRFSQDKWPDNLLETAVVVAVSKPDLDHQLPIVPFSYITWAQYSEFPDCGEAALRNFINHLLYNRSTNMFDIELLKELQQKNYPRMNQKLIDFYSKNSNPRECVDGDVAKQWISTVSCLNKGRDPSSVHIKYRREAQEQNIASPFSNINRVLNALFGIEPLDSTTSIPCLVQNINAIRNDPSCKLNVDVSGIDGDGFGTVTFSDGNAHYELQSYRPVHFAFVRVETVKASPGSEVDYKLFDQLRKHSTLSVPKTTVKRNDVAFFEQLAIASIFIPYQLLRMKLDPFVRKCMPLQYMYYFSDLKSQSQQSTTIRLIEYQRVIMEKHSRRHTMTEPLQDIVQRIKSWKAPIFQPVRSSSLDHEDD